MSIKSLEQDIKHNPRVVSVGGQKYVALNHVEMGVISEELAVQMAEKGKIYREVVSIGGEAQPYVPQLANDLRDKGIMPDTAYDRSVDTIVLFTGIPKGGSINQNRSTEIDHYTAIPLLGVHGITRVGDSFTYLRQQIAERTRIFDIASLVSTVPEDQEMEFVGLRVDSDVSVILPHQHKRLGQELTATMMGHSQSKLEVRSNLYRLFRRGMRDTNELVERWMDPKLNSHLRLQ